MDRDFYCRLHMSAGNERGDVFGGHLNMAAASATCEMVIRIADGSAGRRHDEASGHKLVGL